MGEERGHLPSVVKRFNIDFSSLFSVTPEAAEPIKQAAMAGYPPATKKHAEITGIMAGLQNNNDLHVESIAWHILYTKFETDSYEKEKAVKFMEMTLTGVPDEVKISGEKLAMELASHIPEFKEE